MTSAPVVEAPDDPARLARIVARRSGVRPTSIYDADDLIQEAWFLVQYASGRYDAGRAANWKGGRESFVIGTAARYLRGRMFRKIDQISNRATPVGDCPKPSHHTFECAEDTPYQLMVRYGRGYPKRTKRLIFDLAEGRTSTQIAKERGVSHQAIDSQIKLVRDGR